MRATGLISDAWTTIWSRSTTLIRSERSSFPMSREILVTGASGFVGRRLTAALDRTGYAVRGFSHKDGDLVSAALDFPNVAHVFHLAARTFVPESWSNPKAFYELNVMGTLNVL